MGDGRHAIFSPHSQICSFVIQVTLSIDTGEFGAPPADCNAQTIGEAPASISYRPPVLDPVLEICRRMAISAIFRLAIITLRAEIDPVFLIRGVLKPRKTTHHKILSKDELPDFLKALDNYSGSFANQIALKLTILTLARTNEVLKSKWIEFDLDDAIWTKSAENVKQREDHRVPLPSQAVDLLKGLHFITGNREYLFPNKADPRRPVSKGVLWKAIVRWVIKIDSLPMASVEPDRPY